ncbi:MAG: hypothetical protein EPO20_19690 [Betaproteobacteria bacterium]|nr:MAG: hypothetical protein EPO20_19690 [Betaproteobacteria bacterium]
MRRNDYDVTDSVRTTDPAAVASEVIGLYQSLYTDAAAAQLERAFGHAAALYRGKHPEYSACDTEYHDMQHVLDVTLAMARLLRGYQCGRSRGEPVLTPEAFRVGVLTALFHDFGYLRRRNDRKHRYGAEYTLTHVSRSSAFLRSYLRELGMEEKYARAASVLVHYTGYERPAESIRLGDMLLRRVGHMLGTADIIAQMSDRCYLEKCRDRLYPEFVLGGLAGRRRPGMRRLPVFASGEDLVSKTPNFYAGATRRLELPLARAYEYAARYFGGTNPYLQEMQKNVRYAQALARGSSAELLRRQPPHTLSPGVEPYPKDLIGL